MFLSETELEDSFVVREAELGFLLRIVRENDGPTNQHVIVIGTRGMGKTMLVRRLALAIRKDGLLGRKWYPSILSEEIYDVAGEGELWLRVLERIAIQEREAKRDHLRWLQRYETLRKEMDGRRLKVQALAALSEFATERSAKLLVVVENLQMLLGEQSGINDAWDLRRTLLNNPEVMLVSTATMRFGEIMNADKANFELFREITLAPLSTDDCRVLWRYITGEELAAERIRPMEILTGGSPRLLAILADFAKGRSLAELMDDLVILIDDHTTYFKANVESLPPMERRVFVTLAEIWEPAEARQVAERCRLGVNTASAMLNKLVGRGAVAEAGKVGRKNLYQIVERLYNIYHLMRLSGVEADRVRALVRFMVPLYGKERVACALVNKGVALGSLGRGEGAIAVYDEVISRFGDAEELPLREGVARALNVKAWKVCEIGDSLEVDQAIAAVEKAISIMPQNMAFHHTLACLLGLASRWEETFKLAKRFSDDQDMVEKCSQDILSFFVDAAATGQAEPALRAIEGTKSEPAMEPLVVALKMSAGKPYRAPREVVEMANDIQRRILQRAEVLHSRKVK